MRPPTPKNFRNDLSQKRPILLKKKNCDQNHQQQAIYLNVLNFLMIYQPKHKNENLSFSGWYLAPILPGLTW